ncbi:MAG TPA: SH3 domain-containing protein [Candidatus Sulfotelmatobacter sp.]|nr:SH3 domain-containing protein [Candidatus Sulfotelmatobacter sp.]
MKRRLVGRCAIMACLALLSGVFVLPTANGQAKPYERSFGQSESAVKKALQQMQSGMAGHLPTLDGFAVASGHELERYHRAYFQATTQVSLAADGGSIVRVSAKVTAWYDDPQKAHSGYELLRSNGRIENDILDQLSEQLTASKPSLDKQAEQAANSEQTTRSGQTATSSAQGKAEMMPVPAQGERHSERPRASSEEAISAPQPHLFDSPSTVSSSLARGLASSGNALSSGTAHPETPKTDPERTRLLAELDQLQEIVKNQAHPKNMAAVKKAGTAVVATPSLAAKPIFTASAHDEFEILNYNQDWVHVRISGLSRGWIWRNDLELPDSIPDTQAAPVAAANFFHVVREETAPFPGDWEPLRGKNVKLISVQKIDESSKETGPQVKLDFARSLLDKNYEEVAQKSADLAGIVLIFDSADGGMIAVPEPILQKWKSGKLSDSALWHACYFDPPETFGGDNSAGQ